MKRERNKFRSAVVLFVGVLFLAVLALPAFADDLSDSRQLVTKATMTFANFAKAPEMDALRNLLKSARGVFIAPQILRGAFVVGVAGGTGVFIVHDSKTGYWTGPAFYTIGEGSLGFQIGADASELVLLAMTERGVTALLNSTAKLGADAGIAIGPIGMGAAASTANLSADIISFSRSKGLYAGISFDGAVVAVRDGLNAAFYGKANLSPTDILLRRTVTSTHAIPLIKEVAMAAKK